MTPAAAARAPAAARALSPAVLGLWGNAVPMRYDVAPRAARIASASTFFGGAYTTRSGKQITIYSSDSYAPDAAVNQSWANFIGGLVHGTELSRLTVYVEPLAEVQASCGSARADACYAPSRNTLFAPGQDPPDGVPVEEIVAHEYGHHVANNRANAPWRADAWGTKRWARYEDVCRRTAAGTAFPGDEGRHYYLNPGEAFAESYRVLNDQLGATGGTAAWNADASFTPDAVALAAVRQDVETPWASTAVGRWSGTFDRRGRVVAHPIATPVDGTLVVAATGAVRGVRILSADGSVLAAGTGGATATVCGSAAVTISVTAARRGSYSVQARQP